MDQRKIVCRETAIIAVGELFLSGIVVGIFATLGYFQMNVLWGAVMGSVIMIINFLFMAVTVCLAADRARKGDVKRAQKMVQLSSAVRLLIMGAVLLLGIKLGVNVLTLLLPLVFARPILMLSEFFGKKGEK